MGSNFGDIHLQFYSQLTRKNFPQKINLKILFVENAIFIKTDNSMVKNKIKIVLVTHSSLGNLARKYILKLVKSKNYRKAVCRRSTLQPSVSDDAKCHVPKFQHVQKE